MFEAAFTSVTGVRVVEPSVEQIIAPQGTMRFWSVFIPEDEKGFRRTIFLNESHVASVELYGQDEEQDASVVQLRPVE